MGRSNDGPGKGRAPDPPRTRRGRSRASRGHRPKRSLLGLGRSQCQAWPCFHGFHRFYMSTYDYASVRSDARNREEEPVILCMHVFMTMCLGVAEERDVLRWRRSRVERLPAGNSLHFTTGRRATQIATDRLTTAGSDHLGSAEACRQEDS